MSMLRITFANTELCGCCPVKDLDMKLIAFYDWSVWCECGMGKLTGFDDRELGSSHLCQVAPQGRPSFKIGLSIPFARPAFFGPPWASEEEIQSELAANAAQFSIPKT